MTVRQGPIHRSASKDERILRIHGVPSRYLRYGREDVNKLVLNGFSFDRDWLPKAKSTKQINVRKQQALIEDILDTTALRDTEE